MSINPKPQPPLPGGEYTFISDTGPQPVRPGVPRVNLIPVGDGGSGPLLPRVTKSRKRKALLPTTSEVTSLPRWARIAFAARCAARVLPLLDPAVVGRAGVDLVTAVEQSAARGFLDKRLIVVSIRSLEAVRTGLSRPASDAATSALAAGRAEGCEAAAASAVAMAHQSSDSRDLLLIRSDFEWLRELAEENGWTDDTPVPPDVFGPLWPPRRVPRWARVKDEPRE